MSASAPAPRQHVEGHGRRTYLDTMRGVAVLIMIEAHVVDSWTRAADHSTHWFRQSMVLGGFAAPLFLLLAGVAVAMSAGSKARRSGDAFAAMRAVQIRGLQIFGLALLFRLQSVILSGGIWWTFLKVDILNIMGLSIVAAATIWGFSRNDRNRLLAFALTTAALVLLSPAVRAAGFLTPLPNWLEGYLRPVPNLTNFSIFPWTAFVTAGAALGVVLDATRTAEGDRRLNLAFVAGGLVLAWVAYQCSFLPALDPRSRFWTTSASFFFVRLGLMVAAIGVAYLWERRPVRPFDKLRVVPSDVEGRLGSGQALRLGSGQALRLGSGQAADRGWSPLQVFGRHSLFVYWVHVELVYGVVSLPLHGAFPLWGAWVAVGVVTALMLALTAWKDRMAGKFKPGSHLRSRLKRAAQPLMF